MPHTWVLYGQVVRLLPFESSDITTPTWYVNPFFCTWQYSFRTDRWLMCAYMYLTVVRMKG